MIQRNVQYIYFFRTLLCRVLFLVFVLFLLLLSKPERQCLGFISLPPDGHSNMECRPDDIELHSWSGPGFDAGECWDQGYRFTNGATWGRSDIEDAPFCICEHGKIRVFYTQHKPKKPVTVPVDSLTLLPPLHGSSPTPNDLAKWPIPNIFPVRQRSVICSAKRLNIRVRSRDGCTGCKCSKNGHWLCRRPPPSSRRNRTTNIRPQTSRQHPLTLRNNYYPYDDSSNLVNVQLRVTSSRARPQCSLGSTPQFCILIERLSSANASEKISRYVELPRETSWIDRKKCTRCSCTSNGRLTCEFLDATCSRPCLLHKSRPISMMYYFPSGLKWLTPPNDKCRSCMCVNGQRKCTNCDQILKIDVDTMTVFNNINHQRPAIDEYRVLPSTSIKTKPCLLEINTNSHRLILPGQKTWFEERCYICSKRNGRLVSC